jgi:hypothetical protein
VKNDYRIPAMKFSSVYPLYVAKAERKNRTRAEVDQVICWLTGYSEAGLQQQIEKENTFEQFFAEAPAIHPNSSLIRGVICGVRVEEIDDPLIQKARYLDKLIDELAKGRALAKVMPEEPSTCLYFNTWPISPCPSSSNSSSLGRGCQVSP